MTYFENKNFLLVPFPVGALRFVQIDATLALPSVKNRIKSNVGESLSSVNTLIDYNGCVFIGGRAKVDIV